MALVVLVRVLESPPHEGQVDGQDAWELFWLLFAPCLRHSLVLTRPKPAWPLGQHILHVPHIISRQNFRGLQWQTTFFSLAARKHSAVSNKCDNIYIARYRQLNNRWIHAIWRVHTLDLILAVLQQVHKPWYKTELMNYWTVIDSQSVCISTSVCCIVFQSSCVACCLEFNTSQYCHSLVGKSATKSFFPDVQLIQQKQT